MALSIFREYFAYSGERGKGVWGRIMTARYDPDHAGMGRMLRSDFMERAMRKRAEEIKVRAIALAPVNRDPEDRRRGNYKGSFHIRSHSHGGATRDRAEAILYNDSSDAVWVEFGHRGREPFSVLRRAAFRRIG